MSSYRIAAFLVISALVLLAAGALWQVQAMLLTGATLGALAVLGLPVVMVINGLFGLAGGSNTRAARTKLL